MRLRADRGSGSLLGLAIAGSIIAILSVALPLYIGLSARESLANTADAAALGSADVASGIAPGSPCTIAAHIALANGAVVSACKVDGLVVTVRVNRDFLGIELTAAATAGPPGAGTN
jgi:secretion/DNA translocation related TadE-like protein